ncbi:hypothetical protein Q427_13215 [Halomonas sp. BC04]|nr:hypothetical protein [Halomonas sp. BC04]EWH01599.1 hypothetical protein Q427_13215 [Halomonas sp. BC04]
MTSFRSASCHPVPVNGGRLTRWLRPRVMAQLDRLEGGRITLIEGSQCHHLGQDGPLQVTLVVRDPRAWQRLALGGSVGAAEAYIDGDWDADDLVALIRLFAANLERVNGDMENGTARMADGYWGP